MRNIFTDKYFTKSKIVSEVSGVNPVVKYRVFGRFKGIAALEPAKMLVERLAPTAKVEILPTGTEFEPKDTIMIIEDKFQNIVELETMYLWWVALPCYCAYQAKQIMEVAKDKQVLDFAARHLYGAEAVALASYGAQVGGIQGASTDVGASPINYLKMMIDMYGVEIPDSIAENSVDVPAKGLGTTPHALIAIFKGDYIKMGEAYIKAFPDDQFIALIDYNNKEIDDTIRLVEHFGNKLAGIRIDTCGENHAQVLHDEQALNSGVTGEAVTSLRTALNKNNGKHVKIFVSSGFNAEKTKQFTSLCGESFDGIGTGSFIPKGPTCTADIFEVDGEVESKVGREWGLEANKKFYERLKK